MLNITVLGLILVIVAGGVVVMATLAIKISSKRTPHYERNKYY